MENDTIRQLEHLIQRELETLPELEAPHTLIPHVMARIEGQAHAPAWRRTWWAWPLSLKITSATVLFTLIAIVSYGSHWAAAQWETQELPQTVIRWWDAFASAGAVLGTLGNALLIAGRSIGQPWLLGMFAFVFLMYLTCVGIGTICFRAAVNKR